MYICNNCSAVFENAVSIYKRYDELDGSPAEEYCVCPFCKCDDVMEAVQCDLCGEFVAYDYVRLKDGTIACSVCYETF